MSFSRDWKLPDAEPVNAGALRAESYGDQIDNHEAEEPTIFDAPRATLRKIAAAVREMENTARARKYADLWQRLLVAHDARSFDAMAGFADHLRDSVKDARAERGPK